MTPILHRQRGAVAVMVALAMFVLLAVTGLVVDTGMAYLVKARLNAAVDSAALAAARAVTSGNNQTEQAASAQRAASQFFAANMPASYLTSKPNLLGTTVVFKAGTVTIDVKAEAPMALSLMQATDVSSLMPVATAQTVRKDLDMALVVDTSGSLLDVGATVRSSAKSFLNKFNVTQDRVGLVSFAAGAKVDQAIATSGRGFKRDAMLAAISGYSFVGGTSSVEGMYRAREQLNTIPVASRSSLRVIVFFSDGAPTGFGGRFTFVNGGCTNPGTIDVDEDYYPGLHNLDITARVSAGLGCTLPSNKPWTVVKTLPKYYNAHDPAATEFPVDTSKITNNPALRTVTTDIGSEVMYERNIGRAARNLAESVAAKAREDGIYVFTLGMGSALKNKNADNETGEAVLKCMANVADGPSRCYNAAKPVGMYCYAATDADLTPCFSKLASAILRISK